MMTSSNGNCDWPFVQGFHRSPVNSPHKGQWRGAFMFSLIYAWANGWVNNQNTGDLKPHRAYYDVTVMLSTLTMGVLATGPYQLSKADHMFIFLTTNYEIQEQNNTYIQNTDFIHKYINPT